MGLQHEPDFLYVAPSGLVFENVVCMFLLQILMNANCTLISVRTGAVSTPMVRSAANVLPASLWIARKPSA